MSARSLITLLWLSSISASRLHAQAAQPVVFTHATLIDADPSAARRAFTIVVSNDVIAALYPDGAKQHPANARVIDLRGRYVIPGLVDAHVHLATDPTGRDANAKQQLEGALLGGVTSVRDMAGDARTLRQLAAAGAIPSSKSPAIHFAAVMAGPTFFEDPRTRSAAQGETAGEVAWLKAITATSDIPAAVRAAKATGASAIKLYADLPASLVSSIAAEAHRQGMKVWSHATIYPARPRDAVDAGVDVLSHAILLYWDGAAQVPERYHTRASRSAYDSVDVNGAAITSLLQTMKKKGTVLDATLFISSRLETSPAGTAGMADPRRAVQWMYDVTRRANELGVMVDAGTDGMMPGSTSELPNIHREMELLVTRAGFSPSQAIAAATINSARAIGIQDEVGSIAVGKKADFVVLASNPLVDIRNTRSVDMVVKRGFVHDRAAELASTLSRTPR